MTRSSQPDSFIKEAVVARVLSEDDPITFLVDVGLPLVEAQVGQLDAGGVSSCVTAVVDLVSAQDDTSEPRQWAALELGRSLIGGARREACAEVSCNCAKVLFQLGFGATKQVEASWVRFVRVLCARLLDGALCDECAAEVAKLATSYAERIELDGACSSLELFALLARCHGANSARRALERVEATMLKAATERVERKARRAAVDALAALWRASEQASRVASRLCAELAALVTTEQPEAEAASSNAVGLSRQVEGLSEAACAAIANSSNSQHDAGPAVDRLGAVLEALSAAIHTDWGGMHLKNALRRARTRLLETTLLALAPPLARRRTALLSRLALETAFDFYQPALDVIGLAATSLGPGAGLERAATPLVGLAESMCLQPSEERGPHKRRRKSTGEAVNIQQPSCNNASDARTCLDALTKLVYTCATSLEPAARQLVDSLAAQLCALCARCPQPNLLFWQDPALRVAALRFVKAALAAPRRDGDRTNLVAVAKSAAAAALLEPDAALAKAELQCLLDALLRPRAPPFRPSRPLVEPPILETEAPPGGVTLRDTVAAETLESAGRAATEQTHEAVSELFTETAAEISQEIAAEQAEELAADSSAHPKEILPARQGDNIDRAVANPAQDDHEDCADIDYGFQPPSESIEPPQRLGVASHAGSEKPERILTPLPASMPHQTALESEEDDDEFPDIVVQ